MAHNFVERDEWNDCPGVDAMFLPFLRRNPEFTAHGYAVDWNREDARISLEGVQRLAPFSKKEMADFIQTFNGADEIDASEEYLYCWYD